MDVLTRDPLVHGRTAAVRWAVASLIGNMGLILTGALVRLTESGLGCPTWPKCTADSVIPTGMGLHGVIEFGNRLLTFALVALAIGAYVTARRARTAGGQRRTDIIRLAFIAGLGIPAQAIIGGITVLTKLNPYVVATHLLVSVAIIVTLVLLVRRTRGLEPHDVATTGRCWARIAFGLTMLSIILGTLVTGSAPHSGDADAIRTGFVLDTIAKIHAWSGWALAIATIVTWWLTRSRAAGYLVSVVLFQALVGYLQYFNGLPIWIIALHMVGVAVISAVSANVLFALGGRRPDRPDRNGETLTELVGAGSQRVGHDREHDATTPHN